MIVLTLALINSLCATCGQNGVALAEWDSWFLGARRPEECLETFANRTAGSTVVLHCSILHLLEEAKTKMILGLQSKENVKRRSKTTFYARSKDTIYMTECRAVLIQYCYQILVCYQP